MYEYTDYFRKSSTNRTSLNQISGKPTPLCQPNFLGKPTTCSVYPLSLNVTRTCRWHCVFPELIEDTQHVAGYHRGRYVTHVLSLARDVQYKKLMKGSNPF